MAALPFAWTALRHHAAPGSSESHLVHCAEGIAPMGRSYGVVAPPS